MTSLGDCFPEHLKKQFAERKIIPGAVIKIPDNEVGKYKWHIIIGVDQNKVMIGSVRINTEKNRNVFRTPELESYLYPIYKANNPFLDHDSFVDCWTLIELPIVSYMQRIIDNPNALLGFIRSEDYDVICGLIAQSDNISSNQLKKYNIM